MIPKYAQTREQSYRRIRSQQLKLVAGPDLAGHQVQWDKQYGVLYIDQTLISCTPTEFRLLKLLLEQHEQCVPTALLIRQFGDAALPDAALARETKSKLYRLMTSIRAKIWTCGLDVVSVMGRGYMLISDHAVLDRSLLEATDACSM